ncbi:hypothetical protein [Promicromonospora sp. MEB111]|uniref:hypothetical protein n=1 Tax=Promicromonospora sp. MEB111 TaxID=3040301 RepID=UPI00254C9360|nr:hypothetical protein [Promicromonospora sp. MEB111]
MTDATENVRNSPTAANRSAGPITLGLAGLIIGTILLTVGVGAVGTVAVIIGVAALLIGLAALLDGVHKLVENLDNATQAILDRRP